MNAVFYVLQSGCAWRLLPHDFPCWRTVYNEFRDWQNLGVWEKANAFLVKTWRIKSGRAENPSAAMIDSQSVRTTEKRVLAEDMMELRKSEEENDIFWVETEGLLLRSQVSGGNISDIVI